MSVAILILSMLMHPVHETVSEIEWNDETKRMEIALRLSVLDEQWITRTHARPGESLKQIALRYLKSSYRLDPAKAGARQHSRSDMEAPPAKYPPAKPKVGSAVAENTPSDISPSQLKTGKERASKSENSPADAYHWVGRDEEGSHVWWYFEIQPASRTAPRVIGQRMFFERNDNYANRILILGQVPRRAVTLTIQRPTASLQQDSTNLKAKRPDQSTDDKPKQPQPQ